VPRSYLRLHLQLKILPGHSSGTPGSMQPPGVAGGHETRVSIAIDQENPGVGLGENASGLEQAGHAVPFDRCHGVHGDRLGLWRGARGIGHDWDAGAATVQNAQGWGQGLPASDRHRSPIASAIIHAVYMISIMNTQAIMESKLQIRAKARDGGCGLNRATLKRFQ
jgi:hypothetical protein